MQELYRRLKDRRLKDPRSDLPQEEPPGLYELIDDVYGKKGDVTQKDYNCNSIHENAPG